MSQEGSRLKVSGDAFGAPLHALAGAVSAHFGRSVSETGVRNLMPPIRKNKVDNTQRGEVQCRVCKTTRGEKAPHERAAWASALSKACRQLLTLLSSRGVSCREFSADQLKKYPMWICATSGASPEGYMEVRADGLAGFSVLDHDTPVGPKMLLSVSGVQERQVVSDPTPFDQEKPQLLVSTDGRMHAFVRPHRYLPADAVSNAKDFAAAFRHCEPEALRPEVVLLQTDNGWDYCMHSMMQQHLILRQALDSDCVLFMWVSQAPSHSSWNPVERQWSVPRRLFCGQHLGASAYPPGVNPFQNPDAEGRNEKMEDILRKIAVAGVKDAYTLLSRGPDWHVEAPTDPTDPEGTPAPDPKDYVEKVRAHYNGVPDADVDREASLIFAHAFKLFNIIYWRACVDDLCPHCAALCQRRRATDSTWHPRRVLEPLRHNHYQVYLPEKPGDNTLPEVGGPSAGVAPAKYELVPAPLGGKRNPHKSFLELMGAGHFQMRPMVPVNPSRRRTEGVYQCSNLSCPGGRRCLYFAKSQTELERHERLGHNVAQAAPPAPPASAALESAAAGDVLPGYALGDPRPAKPDSKPPGGADSGPDESDSEPDVDGFREFREYGSRGAGGPGGASGSGGAGGPGGVGPSGASPPEPAEPLAAGPPPKETGGWQVVEVPGGWLRFNAREQKLNAHCRQHGANVCKMDRGLQKQPIGLHMAWLACRCEFPGAHQTKKQEISGPAGSEARSAGRGVFERLAAEKKGVYQEIIRMEAEVCGRSGEPDAINCRKRRA